MIVWLVFEQFLIRSCTMLWLDSVRRQFSTANLLRSCHHNLFQTGQIADVAIIIGTNTDEGTAVFLGPRLTPLNNDDDVFDYVKGLGAGLDNNTVSTVMKLYPDDPALGCPFQTGPERFESQGFQYKRGAAIAGDYFMHAGKRFYAHDHSLRSEKPIYTYRFDQAPWNMKEPSIMIVPPVFVTHYSEVYSISFRPKTIPDACAANTKL